MVTYNIGKIKKFFYALLVVFILIFINGFLNLGGNFLLIFSLIFLIFGSLLIFQTFKTKIKGKFKVYLLLTGFGSILYSISIIYGIFGIRGFYSINSHIYLTTTILSFGAFSFGVIATFLYFKKNKKE